MLLGSARYFLVSTFLSGGSHSFLQGGTDETANPAWGEELPWQPARAGCSRASSSWRLVASLLWFLWARSSPTSYWSEMTTDMKMNLSCFEKKPHLEFVIMSELFMYKLELHDMDKILVLRLGCCILRCKILIILYHQLKECKCCLSPHGPDCKKQPIFKP